MIKVNVEINYNSWHKKIKNPKKYFSKKLKKISNTFKFFKSKNIIFTILLTNSINMQKLNKKFRKKNKSTDVLSFPSFSFKALSLAFHKAKKMARRFRQAIFPNIETVAYRFENRNL